MLQELSCNKLKSQDLAEEDKQQWQTDLSLLTSFSPSLGWPTSNAWPLVTRQAAEPGGQARSCGLESRSESVKRCTGQ